jgi:NAD+ synthase (glutamine-hydrolysing)
LAELYTNQQDQDNLPPYETLETILRMTIEEKCPHATIVAAGFDAVLLERVAQYLKKSEYKRRQPPVGPRVTRCAFGGGWAVSGV